ncbi:MAG TPA: peptidyl-alpha-hydroxyglycine alpha-amidating lyase family protein [Bryobacteraceae bacterium]|nr:peptidyl-alpha-hydroxyglycine alpha-amidating lyase family protein [Bryobacteraceae bacterium]
MLRSLMLLTAFFTAVAFGDDLGGSQVPEIPYESVPNFLKLPPDLYLGEASGVAVNSKKHVFVFSRGNTTGPAYGASAAQILEFSPEGKYIREIGHNLYAWSFAHAIRFDKDDNLWAVDKGSDMIIKFDPEGRVAMVFGRKKEASDEGTEPWKHPKPPLPAINGAFRQPTDVTWDTQGNIFISDGYINSRVAKFDKNGDWVKQWGTPGSGPGEFNTPHSIAADAQGNIYVADRGNRRIQVFDPDGGFLREITINVPMPPVVHLMYGNPPPPAPPASTVGTAPPAATMQNGAPWAICITPGPTQYIYSADAYPGRIYKLSLDGKVLGVFGSMGRQPKQLGWVHEIACPSENEIYVAELLNWRVQKLLLHPSK